MLYRLNCEIYIDAEDGIDPEELAQDMSDGLESTVADRWNPHFDHSDVIGAKVQTINELSEDEADEKGLI